MLTWPFDLIPLELINPLALILPSTFSFSGGVPVPIPIFSVPASTKNTLSFVLPLITKSISLVPSLNSICL